MSEKEVLTLPERIVSIDEATRRIEAKVNQLLDLMRKRAGATDLALASGRKEGFGDGWDAGWHWAQVEAQSMKRARKSQSKPRDPLEKYLAGDDLPH